MYKYPQYCERYVLVNRFAFAINYRVASTAFCRSLGIRYYSSSRRYNQFNIPCVYYHDKITLCLFRNPVEKFISSLNIVNIKIDNAIQLIQNSYLKQDIHFLDQSRFHGYPVVFYRYPDKIPDICEILDINIPKIRNKSTKKIDTTSVQQNKIQEIYKKDYEIWDDLQKNNGICEIYQ